MNNIAFNYFKSNCADSVELLYDDNIKINIEDIVFATNKSDCESVFSVDSAIVNTKYYVDAKFRGNDYFLNTMDNNFKLVNKNKIENYNGYNDESKVFDLNAKIAIVGDKVYSLKPDTFKVNYNSEKVRSLMKNSCVEVVKLSLLLAGNKYSITGKSKYNKLPKKYLSAIMDLLSETYRWTNNVKNGSDKIRCDLEHKN